jgi:hypothetical protein
MPPRQRLRDAATARKLREQLQAEQNATVQHVYKHGFPARTAEDAALEVARQGARKLHGGQILAEEIVQTPEHEAAGEYLVVITLGAAAPTTALAK